MSEPEVFVSLDAGIDGPPDGAFSHALEHVSFEWESWFPGHCHICHCGSAPEDGSVPHDQVLSAGAGIMTCVAGCRGCAYEGDTTRCGPHCGKS